MRPKPAVLATALALALALGLAACGDDGSDATTTEGGAPSGEAEGSEKVEIVEFAYQPDPVVVRTDGKVIWQNEDSAPHTATADDGSFDTGTIEQGKLKSETFKQAGTYAYFCEIHPTMHGTVEVVEKD